MPKEKKDCKFIIKQLSETHTLDYLFGYTHCLSRHGHIEIEEAMNLIDYSVELINKKKGSK